ncbi:MAG: UDP-N-acetylmuramate dehydrogenase [Syntrophomonas sp.]
MYSELADILPPERIKFGELMKNHTTFKIGGPVDVMLIPQRIEELRKVISYCRKNGLPFFVLGRGSNLLVRDKGIRSVVIKLGDNLKDVFISGLEIEAESGTSLSSLAECAASHGLTGLEFAEGIPGSFGGAVVMNAGAYGGEIKDIILEVSALDHSGNIRRYKKQDLSWGYRKSIFQENNHIVVSALIKLKRDDEERIRARMSDFAKRRQDKQPLEYPSAGSTFKRPDGFYVGPMIEELGLKGYTIGGAQVSEKHAGFIINIGNATCSDVLELIELIKIKARERFGVELHPEIRVVGEE